MTNICDKLTYASTSTEISRHAKQVLTDRQRTDGQTNDQKA